VVKSVFCLSPFQSSVVNQQSKDGYAFHKLSLFLQERDKRVPKTDVDKVLENL
jgi:hypothetical protein